MGTATILGRRKQGRSGKVQEWLGVLESMAHAYTPTGSLSPEASTSRSYPRSLFFLPISLSTRSVPPRSITSFNLASTSVKRREISISCAIINRASRKGSMSSTASLMEPRYREKVGRGEGGKNEPERGAWERSSDKQKREGGQKREGEFKDKMLGTAIRQQRRKRRRIANEEQRKGRGL